MSYLFYNSLLMLFSGYALGQVFNINTCGKCTCGKVTHDTEGDDIPPQTPISQPPITQCAQARPKDCQDILDNGFTDTGVYTIYPDGTAGFQVLCDMNDDSRAWTVFQRRVSDSDFYKTWVEYKYGFGDLTENFWLGNHQLHIITSQGWYQLRVDMELPNGTTAYAEYMKFKISDEDSNYRLSVAEYAGNAGDSLLRHNGKSFTTRDNDNDLSAPHNCAQFYHGAWWYEVCHDSNLNGQYGNNNHGQGLNWRTFSTYTKSLSKTEMKVRRFIRRPTSTTVDPESTNNDSVP